MYQSHISMCTFLLQNSKLWDIYLMHREMGLLSCIRTMNRSFCKASTMVADDNSKQITSVSAAVVLTVYNLELVFHAQVFFTLHVTSDSLTNNRCNCFCFMINKHMAREINNSNMTKIYIHTDLMVVLTMYTHWRSNMSFTPTTTFWRWEIDCLTTVE